MFCNNGWGGGGCLWIIILIIIICCCSGGWGRKLWRLWRKLWRLRMRRRLWLLLNSLHTEKRASPGAASMCRSRAASSAVEVHKCDVLRQSFEKGIPRKERSK